jgi:hypothetical protein
MAIVSKPEVIVESKVCKLGISPEHLDFRARQREFGANDSSSRVRARVDVLYYSKVANGRATL